MDGSSTCNLFNPNFNFIMTQDPAHIRKFRFPPPVGPRETVIHKLAENFMCRRCRWEVATSILLPAPSPLPAFCASPRAFRGSQFSPFPVRKSSLYVRSRGVALGEQRWRRRGAPIRTRGAVQRSRVRWERGDNGATCPAHRPWPAKHAASSPHPPSVRSPECFIAGPRWALYTPL